MRRVLVLVVLLVGVRSAAAQPEPTGKHPRIILTPELRAAWKKQAKGDSTVSRAIRRCDDIVKRPKEFARDLYMGLDWMRNLQTCLVAWAATDKDAHAKGAMIFFDAMLDDLENVGDGKGGDAAARRDHGFAIRAMGPYTALAYDWLHDKLSDEQKKKARQRFKAWTDWYADNGYRPRHPGTNYHAGYLAAATLMAIAQGGEAGNDGRALWRKVVDDLWLTDMANALEPGGVLDGGDWGEGWQYGPLSVAEYALGARALRGVGVEIPRIDVWYASLVKHNAHAMTPGGGIYVNGDTNAEPPTANLKPNLLAFGAPIIGDGPKEAQAWARSEIDTLGLTYDDFPLYAALVAASPVEPVKLPRESWPTAYLAAGVGAFYARSHWGQDGVWMAANCTRTVDVDHIHPNAGNVVLSRDGDDVIVDPSPYGTLSTLTSNAPTVESAQLPEDYKPSQAWWSEKTRWVWARQTASGVVAARCDYADQYKFQDRPSDVPEAVRDLVLVPYAKGASGALIVIDRAKSGAKDRELYLRFKSLARLELDGDLATGKRGTTGLTIRRVSASSGTPRLRTQKASDCFKEGVTRGNCDRARLDVDEYSLVVEGPSMSAWHVIDAAAPSKTPPAVTALQGVDGVHLAREGRDAVVVDARGKAVEYTAPKGDAVYHIVVGAAASGGKTHVTATASGSGCKIAVAAAGSGPAVDASPVVVVVDSSCAVKEDPSLVQPLAAVGAVGPPPDAGVATPPGGDGAGSDSVYDAAAGGPGGSSPRSARSGCCGAQASPGSPIAMSFVVALGLAVLLRRPRRRR